MVWNSVFSEFNLYSALLDREGNIWLGTVSQGLYKIEQASPNQSCTGNQSSEYIVVEPNVDFWGITTDHSKFWLLSQSGVLYTMSPEDNVTTKIEITNTDNDAKHQLQDKNNWDIIIDNDGNPWVASDEGVKIYSYDENKQQLDVEKTIVFGVRGSSLMKQQPRMVVNQQATRQN